MKHDDKGVPRGDKLRKIADVGSPNGALVREADGSLLLASGESIKRVAADGRVTDVVDKVGGEIYGLARCTDDSLCITDWEHGRLLRLKDGVLHEIAKGLAHPSGIVPRKDGTVLVKESGRQTNTVGILKRIAADGNVTEFAKLVPPKRG